MVTVIQERDKQNPWAQIAEKGVTNAIKGVTERSDEMSLKRSVEQLGDDADPRDVLKAIIGTNTYSPEAKQQAMKNYMGVENFALAQKKAANEEKRYEQQAKVQQAQANIATNREARAQAEEARKVEEVALKKTEKEQDQTAADDILEQLDLPPEQKEALKGKLGKKDVTKLLAEQFKGSEDSKFDNKVAELNAKKYVDLTDDVEKTKSTLGDLAYVDKLVDELGTTGWVTGALGLSSKAAEAESISFTTIEPIFKLLNPGGGILASYKVKEAQNKFAIKASDSPWLKKAKIKALTRFAQQGLIRSEKKLSLIKQYKGKPPPDVIEQFDKESELMQDALLDYDLTADEVTPPELPGPEEYKNKVIKTPDGRRYASDGLRWTVKK